MKSEIVSRRPRRSLGEIATAVAAWIVPAVVIAIVILKFTKLVAIAHRAIG